MKIRPGVCQYTAVDDCSRFRVFGFYPRRNSLYTLAFLARLIEEMPFPIERVQTDRGTEFCAERVQDWLRANFIKFRPIPPRSPHLSGKVERSQLTDLQEFWANRSRPLTQDAADLECWQFDYNWPRPHGSLKGRTPVERSSELSDQIRDREHVALRFDASQEPLQFSNWAADKAMKTVRCIKTIRKESLQEKRRRDAASH